MWDWIKNLFSIILKIFINFVKEAFDIASKKVIADLHGFAVDVVGKLDVETLTNEEKREKAFEEIKEEAIKRGLETKDSLIYTLVELAYQYYKNNIK